MKLSDNGIGILKSFESCRLESYQDSRGEWTIGWGQEIGVKKGQTISQDEADSMLLDDIIDIEQAVSRMVKVEINQHQFDALVCLAYNIGYPALRMSTLMCMLNAGNYSDAADQFLVWNKAGGKVIAGLSKRRESERALFLS